MSTTRSQSDLVGGKAPKGDCVWLRDALVHPGRSEAHYAGMVEDVERALCRQPDRTGVPQASSKPNLLDSVGPVAAAPCLDRYGRQTACKCHAQLRLGRRAQTPDTQSRTQHNRHEGLTPVHRAVCTAPNLLVHLEAVALGRSQCPLVCSC